MTPDVPPEHLIDGLRTPSQERPYPAEALERLIAIFKQRYDSLTDQRFLDDERTYKLMAAQRMEALIGEGKLRAFIKQAQFDQAKTAIIRACQGTFNVNEHIRQQNNLLNQWDLQPLQDAPAEPLARGLYDLLYGDGPFAARFDAWVDLLAQKKPGVWPAVTYFLMLHDPASYIFVKPTAFQLFLKTTHGESSWPTRPDAATYQRFLNLSYLLLADLAPLGARDLLDVQSFIWTVRYYAEQYAWIFQSSPNNYDLPGALVELDELD